MKYLIFIIIVVSIFRCSNKSDNWITYYDKYNIGSISMPTTPTEILDTMIAPTFKLVMSINKADIDDKLSFSYSLYFPTNINEFDLFQIKKDSSNLKTLFDSMIKGVEKNSNSEAIAKTYFNYPEPGVKITLHLNQTKDIAVCRIIIFDNYIIATNSTGTNDEFSSEMEDKFFKTLRINRENRNRKMSFN